MLTKKGKKILQYIQAFTDTEGYAPTFEEIKQHFNLASTSTVYFHVEKLKNAGFVKPPPKQRRARSIAIRKRVKSEQHYLQSQETAFMIPIYGMANAGVATIIADENLNGHLKVPKKLKLKNHDVFALRIVGDSMNRAKVAGKKMADGDFAVVDPSQRSPRSGDYVLSIINNHANLKKFERNNKTQEIKLAPESSNKKHKPIHISSEDDFFINGKVVAVIKK